MNNLGQATYLAIIKCIGFSPTPPSLRAMGLLPRHGLATQAVLWSAGDLLIPIKPNRGKEEKLFYFKKMEATAKVDPIVPKMMDCNL